MLNRLSRFIRCGVLRTGPLPRENDITVDSDEYERVQSTNPFLQVPDPSTKVLGMHLRGTDKGGHRHRKVGPSAYLPYARAWLQRFNNARILLATDDAEMAREVFAWPREVAKFVIMPNPISNTSRIIGHGAANARILKKPVQEGKNAAASEALLDVLRLKEYQFEVQQPNHKSTRFRSSSLITVANPGGPYEHFRAPKIFTRSRNL